MLEVVLRETLARPEPERCQLRAPDKFGPKGRTNKQTNDQTNKD